MNYQSNTLFLHNGQKGALNMDFVRLHWKNQEALTQCFSEYCPFTGEYSRTPLPNEKHEKTNPENN